VMYFLIVILKSKVLNHAYVLIVLTRSDVFSARIDMLRILLICFLKKCLLCMTNV